MSSSRKKRNSTGKLLEIDLNLDPPYSNLIQNSLNSLCDSSLKRPDFCTAIRILVVSIWLTCLKNQAPK
jgi:hypothetical protein